MRSIDGRADGRWLVGVVVIVTLLVVVALGVWAIFRRPTGRGSLRENSTALSAFNVGVGFLESYRYDKAHAFFERVVRSVPDSAESRFNKGLAALNLQEDYLVVAEEDFLAARELDPELLQAHFGLGVLYHHTQRYAAAVEAFREVVKRDPDDPFALYWLGAALVDSGKADEALPHFERAIERQPALGSALYRLATLYRLAEEPEKAKEALEGFQKLQSSKDAVLVGKKYGESGKYLLAIRHVEGQMMFEPPAIEPALTVVARIVENLPALEPRPDGRAGSAGLAAGDLNGDGHEDFVVCVQEPSGGGWTEVWLSAHEHTFKRLARLDRAGAACSLGDLDGDSDLDVVVAGDGEIALLLNDSKGNFSSSGVKFAPKLPGFPVRVLIFDADSDWDLDVVVACQKRAGDGSLRGSIVLLNNNRDGSFEDIAERCGFAELPFAPIELLFGDLDGDVDQDLVVIAHPDGAVHYYLNDRAWRYRHDSPEVTKRQFPDALQASIETRADDSRHVLEVFSPGGSRQCLVDVEVELSEWIGIRKPYSASLPIELGQESVVSIPGTDGQPRWLVCGTGGAVELVTSKRPAQWIAFDLNGPEDPVKDAGGTWSNLTGVGALVEVRVGGFKRVAQVTGGGAGSSRSSTRVFFDLPPKTSRIDYVRILWPDGVLQSEQGLEAGKIHRIKEIERKPTSCPLLFAWNGEEFAYIGDFLGVGGLGYLEAPDTYNRPDPTELLEIPALAPRRGNGGALEYQLRIAEPLEECTYLDSIRLLAVDHPAGITVHPNEMFAITGPPPGFDLVAFKESARPAEVRDHLGNDVTGELEQIDRVYAEHWKKDRRFPGVAETHSIRLDFGDRLDRILEASNRPVLLLHGYIEYGYSTSNFAASQTQLEFLAPTFSVERDGAWVPLREQWGFPGGTSRWMAVDLAGLLERGDRRLRVETNLEIYWDHAILVAALADTEAAGIRIRELDADGAVLRELGFPRAYDDGRYPVLYDYENVERVGDVLGKNMKPFPGRYTRFGDVKELLRETDDHFVLFGPGDEIAVTFQAERFAELPAGWKRTFFLKASGWCKDTDLYTAHPETVEPLPFRAMKGYPIPAGAERFDSNPERVRKAAEWNTRVVGGVTIGGDN